MTDHGLLTGTRLADLASGSAGAPTPAEWPLLALILAIVAFVGVRVLRMCGLRVWEAATLSVAAPLLVLVNVPLGLIAPNVQLAANLAGCVVPLVLAFSVLATRRAPVLEIVFLIGVGVVAAFFFSRSVATRGILLNYQLATLVNAGCSAALFHSRPQLAGAMAFAASALGVLVGADMLRLRELTATTPAGEIRLGGAGMLDGILITAILSSLVAWAFCILLRLRQPARIDAAA